MSSPTEFKGGLEGYMSGEEAATRGSRVARRSRAFMGGHASAVELSGLEDTAGGGGDDSDSGAPCHLHAETTSSLP
jgi:hypothetical protein